MFFLWILSVVIFMHFIWEDWEWPLCARIFFFFSFSWGCVCVTCVYVPLVRVYYGYFGHESHKVIAYYVVKFFSFNWAFIREFRELSKGCFRSCHFQESYVGFSGIPLHRALCEFRATAKGLMRAFRSYRCQGPYAGFRANVRGLTWTFCAIIVIGAYS